MSSASARSSAAGSTVTYVLLVLHQRPRPLFATHNFEVFKEPTETFAQTLPSYNSVFVAFQGKPKQKMYRGRLLRKRSACLAARSGVAPW